MSTPLNVTTDPGAMSAAASRPLPTALDVDGMLISRLPTFVADLATLLLRAAMQLRREAPASEPSLSLDMDPDRLLDVGAAAEFLGLPKSHLAELGRRGGIARVTHGKYVRFRLGDLRQWIVEHREPGAVEMDSWSAAKRATTTWPGSPEELLLNAGRRRPRRAGAT